MKENFIPVYQFAKKKNVPKQKVYRLIREGKIKDFKVVEKVVKRIFISESVEI